MNIKVSKFKILRVSAGLTQRALASKSGVSRTSICQIEGSEEGIYGLQLRTLCKLAKALGVKVTDLLPDEIK